MARKKLLKNVSITFAGNTHRCRNNKNHIIKKNDKRLSIKENRNLRHYCESCAAEIIATAEDQLITLRLSLESN